MESDLFANYITQSLSSTCASLLRDQNIDILELSIDYLSFNISWVILIKWRSLKKHTRF